jgi:hypothetical protein
VSLAELGGSRTGLGGSLAVLGGSRTGLGGSSKNTMLVRLWVHRGVALLQTTIL